MNKTLKKTLSIILTVLMIVTMAPLAFAAGDGVPLTIDITDKSDVSIGNGKTYYDEDGYIITGTNKDLIVYVYDAESIVLSNASFKELMLGSGDYEFTVTLEGDNYLGDTVNYYGGINFSDQHLIIEGGENDTLNIYGKATAFYTGGRPGTLTVNGGKINAVTETDANYPTLSDFGGFVMNGGEVTLSNNHYYVVSCPVTLNGGVLNVISTAPDTGAINRKINVGKGALLTVSSACGILSDLYSADIVVADDAEENTLLFAKYNTEDEFAPVYDIKSALDGKAYVEIKVDTHEHSYNNGVCVCGYECPHEGLEDGECDVCGVVGTVITITMNDSYGDGWNGNSIVIKQLVDGAYTEVASATFYDGDSDTFTKFLPAEYIYALSWDAAGYTDECSFTVAVDGKTVYECADGSALSVGKVFYVMCEHNIENGSCSECGLTCGVDLEHTLTDYTCTVCGKYMYTITHQPTSVEPYVELNNDTDASYQWYEVEYSGSEITDENADTVVNDWGESSYDKETGWTGVAYDENIPGQDFFTVALKAGETVTVELTGDFTAGVGLFDYNINDGIWIDAEEGVASYEITVGEDGNYTFYTIINSGVVTVKAYVVVANYTAIEGEASAELKNPEIGKRYACEVTYGNGTTEMTDVLKCSYAITHQPTSEEPYVELNDDTDAYYQWHILEEGIAEITDKNASGDWQSMEAPFDNSVYEDGKWVADIWGDRQYYFMVELEEGDTVNFEFASPVSAICFSIGDSNEYIEVGAAEYSITVEESGVYWLVIPESPVEYVRATMTGMVYVPVEGQNSAKLTASTPGTYACEVTFADGTKEMSEAVQSDGAPSKISEVTYTPSTDTHNTFTVKVDGRPTMIQFIEEDGGTRTYDRNNKNVTITAYDADGNEVSSLDRTAAYEVWTVYTNLIGPNVRMRAKYIEDGVYKWEDNTYNFTLEFAEPVYDTEIYESYLEPVTKKGPAKVVLVTGADVQGVRFKMPNGTTTTYYATGAKALEDGKLEYTGKVWFNESGENIIEVYVRSQNTWTYYGYFTGTVE